MVGCEVAGPLWMVLGRSGGLCMRSWAALGAYVGSWGLCGRSWAALGASVGGLGSLLGPRVRSWAAIGAYVGGLRAVLGPMLAILGRSWGLCERSWAPLCASVVQGRCSGLCWRSWGGLLIYVGGPGLSLGLYGRSWAALGASECGPRLRLELMLAVLVCSWDLCWRSWAALGAYVGSLGASWGLSGRS